VLAARLRPLESFFRRAAWFHFQRQAARRKKPRAAEAPESDATFVPHVTEKTFAENAEIGEGARGRVGAWPVAG
jgi:hypothetical protein